MGVILMLYLSRILKSAKFSPKSLKRGLRPCYSWLKGRKLQKLSRIIKKTFFLGGACLGNVLEKSTPLPLSVTSHPGKPPDFNFTNNEMYITCNPHQAHCRIIYDMRVGMPYTTSVYGIQIRLSECTGG